MLTTLSPLAKQMDFSIVTSPVIERELLNMKIPIKYCPFCGRELFSREDIMTLEKFFRMYVGNCAISVIRGDEQLCAVQALDEVEGDEWYDESKASEVTSFKIVPDEFEEDGVVMLITVK